MKNAKLMLGILPILLFCFCANASLSTDPAAMVGFSGTTTFDITVNSVNLNADVEYAVFSPGNYSGNDLTSGREYIYAFQIFNSSDADVVIDFFSVGLANSDLVSNVYTDTTYPSGTVVPFAFEFPQSAGYMFTIASLEQAQSSSVLLFSSTYSPVMGFGAISGGGLATMSALPTVVPEPTTIAFIIPAILAMKKRRK